VARTISVAVVCALVLAGCAGGDTETTAPSWNHNPADTTLGPTAWGGIDASFEQCRGGESQSPVDLTGAAEADLPDLEFDYPETSLVVENTGHVIEARLPEDSDHTLTIGDDEYRLVQFHFHAPSEHAVDGERYAAEVHLVHESEDGELAVVGVVMHPTGGGSTRIVDVVVEAAPEEAGDEAELDVERSPAGLLSALGETIVFGPPYYTYPGSLTTPGCTEGVRWIVMLAILPTSQETVDRLHELIAGFPGYDGYENNSRPLEPLNGRVIEFDPPF
jgi:carbonic anhydrase